MAAEQYDEAIQRYQLLLEKEPADREIRHALAKVLSWNKRFDESIDQYHRLLNDAPADRTLRLELARVFSWAGRYADSILHYDQLIEETPEDKELPRERARVLSWAGSFDEAIEGYQALLTPASPMGLKIEVAQVYSWAGRYSEAATLFNQVLEEDPYEKEALVGLARIHSWQGRHRQALEFYQRALLESNDAGTHAGMAQAYQRFDKWEAAEREYLTALSLDPENKEALAGLEALDIARGPILKLRGGRYEDANGFTRSTYGFDGSHRGWDDLTLHGGAIRNDYRDESGQALSRYSLPLQLDLRFRLVHHLSAGYTFHRFEEENASAYFGRFKREWEKGSAGLSYSRYQIIDNIDHFVDHFYSTLTTIESIRLRISTQEIRAEGAYRFGRRWNISGSLTRGSYSDGNDLWTASSRLTYTFLNSPYLAAYYNFFWTDYERESSLYFSPSRFDVHAVGGVLSLEVRSWAFTAEETFFYQANESAWGNTFIATLGYRIGKRLLPRLTLFFFDSNIHEKSFYASNLAFSLIYHF